MLIHRVVTAIVLLVAFIAAVVWLPTIAFAGLTLIVMLVAAVEWGKIEGLSGKASLFYAAVVAIVMLAFAFFFCSFFRFCDHEGRFALFEILSSGMFFSSLMLTTAVCWVLFALIFLPFSLWKSLPTSLRLVLGGFVLTTSWLAMVSLHVHSETHDRPLGPILFLIPFVLVWLSDSVAFFVGRRFGKHRLAPTISPKKSWEGAIAAVVVVTVVGTIVYAVFQTRLTGLHHENAEQAYSVIETLTRFSPWQVAIGLVVLTVAGIVGDLFESMIKRSAGVKDSGTLLPGHGGILDRIDALLPVLPLFMVFLLAL